MSRLLRVFWLDFRHNFRRPLYLIPLLILALLGWGLSKGAVTISSGDSSVGGLKAVITSEFANAQILANLTLLIFGFFVSVGAGMCIPHDEEHKVGEILHATGLRPWEYIWGKFAATLASFLLLLGAQMAFAAFFNHALPNADAETKKIIGPFQLGAYIRPALMFGLPPILFMAGVAFFLGERTRKPVLVYFFPVIVLMVSIFFLWDWTPPNIDRRLEKLLQVVDVGGARWLQESQLKVDRGAAYYNDQHVPLEPAFVISRLAFMALGLLAVFLSQRNFARTIRGVHAVKPGAAASAPAATPAEAVGFREPAPLGVLAMTYSPASFLREALTVAKFEFKGLIDSPGLYLFVPLILLQTIARVYFQPGPYGTWLLTTSGSFVTLSYNTLTLCIGLLLMFYTAESLHRERTHGLSPIFGSTPVRTGAVLFGKSLANTYIAFVVLTAAWLGGVIIMLLQGKVSMDLNPFVTVWTLLLAPTFLFWSAFIMAVLAITNNKFATYAIGLAALALTGYAQLKGWMNWVFNWNLWRTVRWSDISGLEPNVGPFILNRLLYLLLTVFLIAVTVRVFARREFDATRIVHRFMPGAMLRTLWRMAPFYVPPAVVAIVLGVQVAHGFQGKGMTNKEKDYWVQNLATWKDTDPPAIANADVTLKLDPARCWFKTKGFMDLKNIDPAEMRKFCLTIMQGVKDVAWTLDGKEFKPEDKSHLFVFAPPAPMKTGDSVRVGFEYEGAFPAGITKNGGGMMEFIQPGGVVLGAWSANFFPGVGYDESQGVEADKNRYEPRQYPDDYHKKIVKAAFGSRMPFPVHVVVEGPAEYQYNSVGVLVSDKVKDGTRRTEWKSDHPVMMFNVIAGKWNVKRGEGTALYYNPMHTYNVDEMLTGLNGARKYFSEWFYPYPWKELKLSEFPALATYAQGFATNITFSEGIGFLTRNTEAGRAAFTITAHESAHQWWGNTLVPGDGPGGNILSEGMAHFSVIMLSQQVMGTQARIEFCKRIEERYGEDRQVDSERAMNKILGDKPGDTTVTYDRGGWVFWMLHNLMGREANLKGLQAFIKNHVANPDHPLIEDFVEEMRPFATDKAAFDAFASQWIYDTVVPEFKIEDVKVSEAGGKHVVTGTVKNSGRGTVSIEVAAISTEDRFVKQTEAEAAKGPAAVAKEYKDARTTVALNAGETKKFEIACGFAPKAVQADPDAMVLQIRRKDAIFRLKGEKDEKALAKR